MCRSTTPTHYGYNKINVTAKSFCCSGKSSNFDLPSNSKQSGMKTGPMSPGLVGVLCKELSCDRSKDSKKMKQQGIEKKRRCKWLIAISKRFNNNLPYIHACK